MCPLKQQYIGSIVVINGAVGAAMGTYQHLTSAGREGSIVAAVLRHTTFTMCSPPLCAAAVTLIVITQWVVKVLDLLATYLDNCRPISTGDNM
jgi:energy-converting hydrogenase Eha subunit B